jgi:hypothetical protein
MLSVMPMPAGAVHLLAASVAIAAISGCETTRMPAFVGDVIIASRTAPLQVHPARFMIIDRHGDGTTLLGLALDVWHRGNEDPEGFPPLSIVLVDDGSRSRWEAWLLDDDLACHTTHEIDRWRSFGALTPAERTRLGDAWRLDGPVELQSLGAGGRDFRLTAHVVGATPRIGTIALDGEFCIHEHSYSPPLFVLWCLGTGARP